jgi:HSP20 family molecular chaperone IbpA
VSAELESGILRVQINRLPKSLPKTIEIKELESG